jgi:acetoin utilization protein AcuB
VTSEVKSYMTGQPVSIEPDASALAALDLMVEHGIRHLPVLDAAHRVCGVLSFDDLRAALPVPLSLRAPLPLEDRESAEELVVGEVMTYAPETIHYDAPLEEAAQRMADGRFGCLPVVDDEGRLDGILTETDLLHALITALWAARREERRGEGPPAAAPERVGLGESLERERAYLARRLADYEHHEQEITEQRREVPLDLAEHGSEAEEARLTEQLAGLAARRLRAIEHALERSEAGKLGVCERCEGAIPEGRLRALPGTTLCIRCARAEEVGR